ncbi:hypothetical protein [Ornithinibacillus xuwenensis]|uniref:Uncharacterized protein n=1 Tax=Ornithinibacillus xuwenensis TaxID=3144668 RepID=A0ABU9XL40_9BACI
MKKKVLVGLMIVLLLMLAKEVYVYASSKNSLLDNGMLQHAISTMEEWLNIQKDGVHELFYDLEDGGSSTIEDKVDDIYLAISSETVEEIEAHNRNYLSSLSSERESFSSEQLFHEYTQEKQAEIQTEIEADLEDFLLELLETEATKNNE